MVKCQNAIKYLFPRFIRDFIILNVNFLCVNLNTCMYVGGSLPQQRTHETASMKSYLYSTMLMFADYSYFGGHDRDYDLH